MTTAHSREVFIDQLNDIYSVVEQVTKTMPDLQGRSSDESLAALLERHCLETLHHQVAVTAIFDEHGLKRGEDICKAIHGLIEGGNHHIQQARDPIIRDLLLIAHCSRIAHYEIAAYSFTSGVASRADLVTEARILAEILEEEKAFLRDLAQVGSMRFGVQTSGAT